MMNSHWDTRKRVKLFCLPYAGGSATAYSTWKKMFHSTIQVIPVELAGRGSRWDVPFYPHIVNEGIDDLFEMMKHDLDGGPFALFGHSMGTVLAYELGHRIKMETKQSPIHMFFSGRGAPHHKKQEPDIHLLPDAEFQSAVLKLGGTSPEVFEHKSLADMFMPILKNDYRLIETYVYQAKDSKLSCNITILLGKEDSYDYKDGEEWGEYTDGKFSIHMFKGDHFFINSNKQQVIQLIQHTLLPASLYLDQRSFQ
ncbi:thioesterase [Paenibacillus sp. PR3]|uniref:Thioesterase n=1 Tax=Paenibacillus terricola TaxID=2763503 RepID=A0ABR8MW36_9BACL|nr:thioesterase [Paenibacillus terricola]MBD3919140.1 thioesterase [Paenibacillus terricola]